MKVGVRYYYSVGRLAVKFRRIRSSFDAPTDNYSDNIVGQTSDVFGLRKLPSGLSLSSLPQPTALLVRVSESCPGPEPGSRHRWIQIIPKHLQNISNSLLGSPKLFILNHTILIG